MTFKMPIRPPSQGGSLTSSRQFYFWACSSRKGQDWRLTFGSHLHIDGINIMGLNEIHQEDRVAREEDPGKSLEVKQRRCSQIKRLKGSIQGDRREGIKHEKLVSQKPRKETVWVIFTLKLAQIVQKVAELLRALSQSFLSHYSSQKEKGQGHGHKLPPKCIPLVSWSILIAPLPPLYHGSGSSFIGTDSRESSPSQKTTAFRTHHSNQLYLWENDFLFTYIMYIRILSYRLPSDTPQMMNVGWFAYY